MKTTRFVLALILACAGAPAHSQPEPVVGFITKTETNPFFVKMREGATETAKARLDSPADPQDATDALFATDNFKAGLLIGHHASHRAARHRGRTAG